MEIQVYDSETAELRRVRKRIEELEGALHIAIEWMRGMGPCSQAVADQLEKVLEADE
jgi:hypothetical protein